MSEPIAVAFVEVRPDVDDFRANAESELRGTVDEKSLSVRGAVELDTSQATAQVSTLAAETQRVIDELAAQTSPDFAQGFVVGAQEAVASALELGETTEQTSQAIIDGQGAREAFAAANATAAASEALLASQMRASGDAVVEAGAAEADLIRLRGRRAQSVGPFRLAGIGLGAGVALFAATRALGELGAGLAVTGNEALTFEGRMRNLGSSILGGDVVGAFKALNNQTKDYSASAVLAIDRSDVLAESLEKAGIALNEIGGLAESRLKAAEQFVQVPQFLQTRIAEAQFTGNEGDQIAALEEADRIAAENIEKLRDLNLTQTQLSAALEEVYKQRKSFKDQIESITKDSRPDILAPLVEAVTDARLTGDSQLILAALRDEAAKLQTVIGAAQTNAADRRKFKDQLITVNKEIEATQDAIVAEEQRHRQAMLDKLLQTSESAALAAEAQGQSTLPADLQRQATIRATLARGTLDGKKLTQAEIDRLNSELISVNASIESSQQAIADEADRHARDMEQKLADADDAFLRAMSGRQHRARSKQVVAAATATLADDIRVSNELQAIFKADIARARKTINDARVRADTIAQLTDELLQESLNERELRQQARRDRIDRKAESLDLNIQIAQANDNTRAEIRAHNAKIRFLQERIRHTRAGTNQRKRLILELRQEQASVRELLKEGKEDAADSQATFQQLSFAFLQERENLQNQFASNIQTTNPGLAPPAPREPASLPPRPPLSSQPAPIPSPLARAGGRGADNMPLDPGEAATKLRESGGQPASSGQLESMIALTRETNQLLRDIRRGVGHQEAKTARALSHNRVEAGR